MSPWSRAAVDRANTAPGGTTGRYSAHCISRSSVVREVEIRTPRVGARNLFVRSSAYVSSSVPLAVMTNGATACVESPAMVPLCAVVGPRQSALVRSVDCQLSTIEARPIVDHAVVVESCLTYRPFQDPKRQQVHDQQLGVIEKCQREFQSLRFRHATCADGPSRGR